MIIVSLRPFLAYEFGSEILVIKNAYVDLLTFFFPFMEADWDRFGQKMSLS